MPIPFHDVPEAASAASLQFRDAVAEVLGDDCVAMWLYGGTTFPDRPRRPGDLDVALVLAGVSADERDPDVWRDQPESRPSLLRAAEGAIATDRGITFDTLYLVRDETNHSDLPAHAFWRKRRCTDWAVLRAHWLAGQYMPLHGRRPDELVVPPTEAELHVALDRELEHLERHVYEGDAKDPYEATYAIWNGCRILYALETGSPVISKRSAGNWGLRHLPDRWHDAIHAADRAYDGEATTGDNELLRLTMPPFVEMVREHLPPTQPRPPGPPRWS